MSTSNIPDVLPVYPEVLPVRPARAAPPPPAARGNRLLRWLGALCGWLWRWVAASVMCFNGLALGLGPTGPVIAPVLAETGATVAIPLSYLTSIIAVGWTYRWMQAVVLRGWWKRSPKRQEGSFQDFCDSLGRDAPVPRPRWFLRERIAAYLSRPAPGGQQAGVLRRFGRALTVPWHSLWLNFKTGLAAVFCTYLLTGWGCLLMLFSWEFGWFNSINRYYEQAWVGPVTGLVGSLLFILAMFYVPMAQAHQAATGQARAFFDFRFVRRLVRARLLAYVGLAILMWLASLTLSIAVLASAAQPFADPKAMSAAEGLEAFRHYLGAWTFLGLVPAYLLLHFVAAVIYRSAVLKVLRQGVVTRAELNPVLARWLDKLDLNVTPRAERTGLTWYAKLTARFAYRRVLFTVLFLLWAAFVMRFYVHYFFRSHPVVGFLNHPMIQMPCFDFIPEHLHLGRDE
jgi:hypothetical protein